MNLLVVDTDVTSYVFRWHPLAAAYLDLLKGGDPIISFMTLAEMRFGALRARWGAARSDLLERYLSDFPICYPDQSLCRLWAEVKHESNQKGRPISSPDAWIAATALYLKAPLITNNPSHFLQLDRLEVRTIASKGGSWQ